MMDKMKSKRFILLCILAFILLTGGIYIGLYSNIIGINQFDIEADARQFQNISDEWNVYQETTATMSALLFFSDDLSDHIYSIYLNRHNFSSRYFLGQAEQ